MMLPSNFTFIESLVERFNNELKTANELIAFLEKCPKNIKDLVIEHKYRHNREVDEVLGDLKSQYWREVYARSNLGDVISSKAREEIESGFYNNKANLPDFTEENIKSTVSSWANDSYRMFGEKIDLIFNRLSGEHVTNSPSGFTKKMIYKYMINYTCAWGSIHFDRYTFNDSAVGLIHDLRTSIQMLYGLPISERYDTYTLLKSINSRNEYTEFDNNAFKIKVFKNGNSHIEIHPHVAIMLNQELAKLYPSAIPPKHRTITKEIPDYKFEYDHLSFKEIEKLKSFIISTRSLKQADGKIRYKVGSKSFYCDDFLQGILNFFQVKTIIQNDEYESYFDLVEPFRHIITNGVVEYKTNQYYPTPDNIVDVLVDYVGNVEGRRVLEPSAGMGNIACRFENITCVDKEPLNCVILKNRGLNVIYEDFLKYAVKKDVDKYDVIVMNPPYNKKQWKTHVDHALTLLKTDGIIYAVLPLNKESEFENCELMEVFENSFDNTAISTALYKITNL